MSADVGPVSRLIAPWNVEQAVLATLATWLDFYLYRVEEQNGLRAGTLPRPPAPESLAGGVDFESWTEDLLPMVIVVCNPIGEPELNPSVGYSQVFAVDIGTVAGGDDENAARQRAGLYAAAVVGVLLERGSLGGFSARTRMVGSPRVSLPDPEIRLLALGECSFHLQVDGVASDQTGPTSPTPPTDPSIPPQPWPPVTSTAGIAVSVEPIDEP